MSLKRFVPPAATALLSVTALAPVAAGQGSAAPRDTGDYLHPFVVVRATPGRLLDLIELYRSRMVAWHEDPYAAGPPLHAGPDSSDGPAVGSAA